VKRNMIVAGLAGLALAAAPLAASQASTGQCQAAHSQRCQTPVVAVSATNSTDLTPAADFALQYAGPTPAAAYGAIRTNTSSSLTGGTEDWTWKQITTVPAPGAGRGTFGFTRFDNRNFGGDPVYELKYTPYGQDTGLCLTISSKYRPNGAVLGGCIGAAQQSFIVTQTAPGLEDLTGPTAAYYYAFDVSQNLTVTQQHHLALLAPHAHHNHELVAAGSPVYVGAGLASLDEWSSTP
jgi:hypothetical protein